MKQREVAALMGKVVVVNAKLIKSKTCGGTSQVKQKRYNITPRAGWITGIRYLPQGKVVTYDYPEFTPEGDYIPCLLVVFWPTMQPIRVPMDAWREAKEGEVPVPTQYPWTERDRAALREEMADMPRDARGRWQSSYKG